MQPMVCFFFSKIAFLTTILILNMVLPKDTITGQEKGQTGRTLKTNLNVSYPYWRYLRLDYKSILLW